MCVVWDLGWWVQLVGWVDLRAIRHAFFFLVRGSVGLMTLLSSLLFLFANQLIYLMAYSPTYSSAFTPTLSSKGESTGEFDSTATG